MTTIRAARVVLILVVASLGMRATADAQTNDEATPFPGLQWNFSTPGARANGMGRTFIGIADDATAAVTNPAGLMSLTKPQIYGEYKNTRLKVDRLADINSLTTLQPTTNTSTVNALSFFSLSYPVNNKIAVAFSIYRFLDYHETFNFATRRIPNYPGGENFFFPISGSADFTGTAYSVSAAYMVTNALRVGVTVSGNQVNADSLATRTDFIRGPNFNATTNPNDFISSGIIANQTSIHESQTKASASVGVLYRVNDMVSLGFSAVKSPRFTMSENLQTNPGFRTTNTLPFGTNQTLVQSSSFPKSFELNVPNHFGFGVSVRPNARLLVAGDVVRINYSSLSQPTTLVFFPSLTGNEYVTPDVTEVHIGAEYNIYNMKGNPLFVRAGVFTNPNHLVTFTGTSDPAINASEAANYNLLPRKDETSGTFGVGIALGPRAQIDAAYVFRKEFVLSSAVRF
jgi:long-subunit fatty acid transport protein